MVIPYFAQVAAMAVATIPSSVQASAQAAQGASPEAMPGVRLEVRQGKGPATSYAVSEAGFVIGSVPGCDLRVPGKDLPAVLCLIARQPGRAILRKLAPTQAVLLNG